MNSNYPNGLFHEWEIAIAIKHVRQFRSTCQCLERDFEDDLVDECLKHWYFLRVTVKPEAEGKRRAYMGAIVKNKLCDIVRERTSRKSSFSFSVEQFKNAGLEPIDLQEAIKKDGYGWNIKATDSIDWLNELLGDSGLYNLLESKGYEPTKEILDAQNNLWRSVSVCRRLNRLILEEIYLEQCPNIPKNHNKFFQEISLDQFLDDTPDSPFLAHPAQRSPIDETELSELKFKLNQVFKKLNPQQKKVYEALHDANLTITQISVSLKLHRSTVYDEINRIKEIFEDEGLREYLQ